ncbi:MAG: Ig-like domain-containing protein [Pseudomonadota bacterium]
MVIDTPSHLFNAEFVRDGSDLVLKNNGSDDIRIVDYFAQTPPADLVTENGARLTGDTVEKLAGPMAPGQYAQAGTADGGQAIGQVETIEGAAQVQRADGTIEDLSFGMKVFQNDVVSTADGGSLSVTFLDGTIFTLSANSRMVLDELVYSPGGDDNSATFSLIQGGFVFVAGQVAKTGEMDVATPSATMGIRGTTVSANIATVDGVLALTVTLLEDFDGSGTGVVQLFDLDGNLITTITATDTKWVIPLGDDEPYEVPRTAADDAADEAIILDAANAYAQAYTRFANGDSFVEQDSTTSTPSPTVDDTPSELDDGPEDDGGTAPDVEGGSDDSSGGETGPTTPLINDDPTELDTLEDDGATNTPPTAPDSTLTTNEDNGFSGTLPGTDPEGGAVNFTLTTGPENGTVALLSDGSFVYTPDTDFNGEDSFTYSVTDASGGTTTATVTVTVDPVNDAPVLATAVDITATEDGGVISGTVAGSFTDADGDTLTYSVVTDPGASAPDSQDGANPAGNIFRGPGPFGGTVAMDPDGTFTYEPFPDFEGTDSFTYVIDDGNGGVVEGTVSITVTGVNDAPVADDVAIELEEDGSFSGNLALSAADVDNTDAELTFSLVESEEPTFFESEFSLGTGPFNGTVVINEDGTYTYTPDPDFNGTDSFQYEVTDPDGETSIATVSITVNAVDDVPIANDLSFNGVEDDKLDGTVTAQNPDNETLTYSVLTQPVNGTVDMNLDGTFVYTPDPDFNGTVTFTYQVTDSTFLDQAFDESVPQFGTVTINLSPENDAPEAEDQFFEVPAVPTFEGTIDATDIDGDDLQFSLVTSPGDDPLGTLTVNEDGTFTYERDDFGSGFDVFTVEITDGEETVTVDLTFALEDDGGEVAEELGLGVDFNLTATEEAPAGSATVTVSQPASTPINIVFAMDQSGSFSDEFGEQIAAVRDTIKALVAQFEGSTTPVTIQLTVFNSTATNSGPFDLTNDAAIVDGELTGAIADALTQIENNFAGGGTSWVSAINAADSFYDNQEDFYQSLTDETGEQFGDPVNLLYLITDGQPSDSQTAIGAALANLLDSENGHDVNIQTFGIGTGFDPTLLEQTYTVGGVVYPFDSDGDASVVGITDPITGQNNLSEVLLGSAIFAAELTSFELSLEADGVNLGVIADETSDAFEGQDLNFLLSLAEVDGIEDLLGDVNNLQAVAVFDIDGDETTTDDQVTVVSTVQIVAQDTGQELTGLDGADLLVGGGSNDTLTGNEGSDVLFAGGGLNELYGGADDDILVVNAVQDTGSVMDGGAGDDDWLSFTMAGDLTGILPTLTISDMEALDMENGVANALTLTAADVAGLSSEASGLANELFSGAIDPDSTIMVFGDEGDTLNLDSPDGFVVQLGTVTDGDDSYTLYSFFSPGGDPAFVAVDDDITVNATLVSF